MNVYYIGIFRDSSRQHYLRRILQSFGNYIEDDWASRIAFMGKTGFNQYVIKRCSDFKPGLIFMQLQTADILDIATVQASKNENNIIFNFTGDVRHPLPQHYITLGRHVSATLFTNVADVNTAVAQGIKAEYYQITNDCHIYNPAGPVEHAAGIIFMGNNYDNWFPLSGLRMVMCRTLKQRCRSAFKVFGNGWGDTGSGQLNGNSAREAAIYRGCKIAINLSHFDYERYSSDRIFRIMMTGAFCLSHHYKNIEQDFTPGTHLATWTDIENLQTQIDYYLAHDAERNRIALAGFKHVTENHGEKRRAEELAVLIEKYKLVGEI